MDSKSHWWTSLRIPRRHGAQAPVSRSRRVSKQAQFLAAAGEDATSDTSDFRRHVQPPREGGTWFALGLAVTLHALLAALLFPAPHGPHWIRAGGQHLSGTIERRAAPQPLKAAPQIAWQSAVLPARRDNRLAAGREQTSLSHIHEKPRLLHAQRHVRFAADSSTVHRIALVPMSRTRGAPSSASSDLEHDARVAALQAMAGASVLGNARLERERDTTTVSPGYVDKITRRLRANVIAPFAIQGNPSAIVAVMCAPNGELLGATLQRSSGNPQWDRAVLSAVEKSAPMPVDVNGAAPASFTITFRPKG